MIRFGLIGAGRIGQVHALAIDGLPNARISRVVDVFADSAKALAEQCGAEVSTEDEIFDSSDIDAVIIASSTDTHAHLLERCAESGKAVFCEKPLDLDYDRALHCSDIVAAANVPCMLGFNRRFDPQFSELKSRIESGAIGKLETLHITSRDPEPPPLEYIKVSGGLFRDMMIHDFDMARWLLDEEPSRLYASGSVMVDSAIGDAGDIDTACVTLETASGKIATIVNSRRASYGYDQRVEAFGSDGMLQANNQPEDQLSLANTSGINSAKPQYFFLERYAAAYRLELHHFVEAMAGGEQPLTTTDDGLKALKLADMAVQSFETGQAVTL